ncbi:hypothetical protein GJ496_008381 [Pomphorhynchus laevis]|nr:hypothetical protein GJ496_008381 [Pomphorhynchus laevis]
MLFSAILEHFEGILKQTTEIQSSSINNNRLVFVYVRIKSADKISIGVINENNIGTLTTCGYDTYRGCIEYW